MPILRDHITIWKVVEKESAATGGSSEVVDDEETKSHKDRDACPEDPFVLLGSSLNHPNGVAADPEGVGHVVQFLLRPF